MSMDLLAAFLKTVGAFQTRHSGKTLGHHLLGTYALLADAGCDEETCLAGGLHSIYGTRRFQTSLLHHLSARDVDRVADLFGDEVEETIQNFRFYDTKTIEDVATRDPDDRQFFILTLITAANILEQGGSLDRWPRIKAVWDEQVARAHSGKEPADSEI